MLLLFTSTTEQALRSRMKRELNDHCDRTLKLHPALPLSVRGVSCLNSALREVQSTGSSTVSVTYKELD